MSPFLKAKIRTLLRQLRIRARPGGDTFNTMAGFARHLKHRGFSPGTIIDVGVADGTLELYSPFPSAQLLLIEPMPTFAAPIRSILRRWTGVCVPCAAGSEEGEMLIASSASHSGSHNARTARQGEEGHRVDVRRVDRLVKQLGAGAHDRLPPPYVLKVDVEGAEMDVVRGAVELLPQTEVVILEAALFPFAGRRELAPEMINEMERLGFSLYGVFDGIVRPFDGAPAIYDLAFVRSDGPLRQSNEFNSPVVHPWFKMMGAVRDALRA